MIYSSGRESYFNLNSTWYDPAGSWLDTRRTPFRYGYNNCCSGCDGEGVEGMRGHNYRHYGYRQSVCSERCQGSATADSCHGGGGSGCSTCVRRPTYSYGSSAGCNSYGRSVCSERCHGSSGSCHGGGSSCVGRPTYTCGSSGGCHSHGRSVCSETCHGAGYQGGKPSYSKPTQCCPTQTSGGCHSYGRSVCSETCHGAGYQGGKPSYSRPTQCVSQCCPVQTCPPPMKTCPPPMQTCPPPVQTCPPPMKTCPPPMKTRPPPMQTCPPPMQTCPPPMQTCPPPMQQGYVPVTKCIPSQQKQPVCKVPARKIK